jgi:hypothetical protein
MKLSEEQFNLIIKTCCRNRAVRSIEAARLVFFDGLSPLDAEEKTRGPKDQTMGVVKIVEREIKFFDDMTKAGT